MKTRTTIFTIFLTVFLLNNNATPAIEMTNSHLKIFVGETGIYRLTAEQLEENGFELNGIDPRNFHLSSGGNEVPIHIVGESDGRFDRHDYLQFFGRATDSPYTNWNIYRLSVEETSGRRIIEIPATPTDPTAKKILTFRSKLRFEKDLIHDHLRHVSDADVSPNDKHGWFDKVDLWFWDGIKTYGDLNQLDIEFPTHHLAKSFDRPKISVTLQGASQTNHEILVSLNGIRIGIAKWFGQEKITLDRTFRTWRNFRDANGRDTTNGENNHLTIARVDASTEDDTMAYPYHVYLDSIEVEYTRLFTVENDRLDFSLSQKSGNDESSHYTLNGFESPEIDIFAHDGKNLMAKLKNPHIFRSEDDDQFSVTFQLENEQLSHFIAISSEGFFTPDRLKKVRSNNLLDRSNRADYLVITHHNFADAADRLVKFRATPEGGNFRAKLIELNSIYDTFSHGMVDPKAIKNFLKFAYENWAKPAISHVVLLGDGTYDFRGVDREIYPKPPELVGYIPTHYIWTRSFGQTATDHWYSTVSGFDELPDFYLGRLSVETLEDAHNVVDKIINYGSNLPNGQWRRRIISVADDDVNNPSDYIFRQSLNQIAENETLLGYETVKIFLEDVNKTVAIDPEKFDNKLPRRVAKDRVISALSDGALIAQYAGHGGRIVWAHEAIFDNRSVDFLDETEHLPFMLVLSCYNGYFDFPGEPSMAEKLLRKKNGGIIGMLSATRLTYAQGNHSLNQIIFAQIFDQGVRNLGEIVDNSKRNFLSTKGMSQINSIMGYSLFGDPAVNLATADYELRTTIKNSTVNKDGTLRVESGKVSEQNGSIVSDFNGELKITAFFPGSDEEFLVNGKKVNVYSGDIILEKSSEIIDGNFPSIDFEIPEKVQAGQGHVELYAQKRMSIGVGGVAFNVLEPRILEIRTEKIDDENWTILTKISSAKISDKQGDNGIEKVQLEWYDPIELKWHVVALTNSSDASWYKPSEVFPNPKNGGAIRYQIRVKDVDGRSASSGIREFQPIILPNFKALKNSTISYDYSQSEQNWYLSSIVEKTEAVTLTENLNVHFFDGKVDLDQRLGVAEISPEMWQTGHHLAEPLNDNFMAEATIKISKQLPLGTHQIFVAIDPNRQIPESDRSDNIFSEILKIESLLIDRDGGKFFSSDKTAEVSISAGSLSTPSILTISPIDDSNYSHKIAFDPEPPSPTFQLAMKTNSEELFMFFWLDRLEKWVRLNSEENAEGWIGAEVNLRNSASGIFSLRRHDDRTPPEIELTIGEQNFIDGGTTSSEPLIEGIITDATSGVDTVFRPIELTIDNSTKLYELELQEYGDRVIFRERLPKLAPGRHSVRLEVSDLEGNRSEKLLEFRVNGHLSILDPMNYPNPFSDKTTITFELTDLADYVSIKVYTLSGRLIWETKIDAPIGFMLSEWNGLDQEGDEVANGIYYGKIRVVRVSDQINETKILKILKIK